MSGDSDLHDLDLAKIRLELDLISTLPSTRVKELKSAGGDDHAEVYRVDPLDNDLERRAWDALSAVGKIGG